MNNNLDFIQPLLQDAPAILKCQESTFAGNTNRAVFLTSRVEPNGTIYGYIPASSMPQTPAPIRISLKYACKISNMFVNISGIAHLEDIATTISSTQTVAHGVLIRIRVKQADCFQKKTVSLHTSFLQKIFSFTYKTRITSNHPPAKKRSFNLSRMLNSYQKSA